MTDCGRHIYDINDAGWVCLMCGAIVFYTDMHTQWHATYNGCCTDAMLDKIGTWP